MNALVKTGNSRAGEQVWLRCQGGGKGEREGRGERLYIGRGGDSK